MLVAFVALATSTGFKIDAKSTRFVKRVQSWSKELKIISVVPMKTQVLQGAGSADTPPMKLGCPAFAQMTGVLRPPMNVPTRP